MMSQHVRIAMLRHLVRNYVWWHLIRGKIILKLCSKYQAKTKLRRLVSAYVRKLSTIRPCITSSIVTYAKEGKWVCYIQLL